MGSTVGKRRYGIVGGMNDFVASDMLLRMDEACCALPGKESVEGVLDHHASAACTRGAPELASDQTAKKLYLYEAFRRFESAGMDAIILPYFDGYAFIDELRAEICLPVFDLFEALLIHFEGLGSSARRIGVLTTDSLREQGVFERRLGSVRRQIVYPEAMIQRSCVMPALLGEGGEATDMDIGSGDALRQDLLSKACHNLVALGADVIVPACTAWAALTETLRAQGFPVMDVGRIYADYIASNPPAPVQKPFKIGVVGGVGPAATVDLLNKIVINTDANCDQDHVKVVVEQNPQIPDRTENLLHDGRDPTIALYATCRRLQDDDASIIAIPCNTAHVFVPRIQPYLSIPIVNMLQVTMGYIGETYPAQKQKVGLLATTGTIETRVYHEAARAVGIELLVPDADNQSYVMEAIYGARGVKAGYTEGECLTHLLSAMTSLVSRGAEILILGCTELPLLMQQNPAYPIAGKAVAIVDPTDILAKTCVRLAREYEAM